MLKIVTDSCSGLSDEYLQQHDIAVAPLHLQVDGENFTPGEDISYAEALDKIAAAHDMPKTSQPSPEAYAQAYRCAAQEQVLCLTLSSQVSGSYNSARLAAQDIPDKQIAVHDTLMGSFAQGFQVMLAQRMQAEGCGLEAIKQALAEYYRRSSMIVILEKYDNAIKSGRVNKYAGKIIEKLNIRGIIEILEGKVVVVDKARGAEKTFQKMLERISSKAGDFSQAVIGIAHFHNRPMAEKYRDSLQSRLSPRRIFMGNIDPTLAVYCDAGGVVISVCPDPDTFTI